MILPTLRLILSILLILNIFGAVHSREISEQYHVGVSWQGSSIMSERVLSGLQKFISDYSPQIHLEVLSGQSDIESLNSVISYFEQTKDAMVIFRSNGAQLLTTRGVMIPAFVGSINNPVELGITTSMIRPDKNITGVTYSLSTLVKLEAFRQIYPNMKRFVLLVEEGHPGTPIDVRETKIAARKLGLEGRVVYCQTLEDILETVNQNSKDEIIILGIQALIMDNVTEIVKAAGNRIVFSYSEQAVENGALAGIVADDHKLGQMLGQMIIENLLYAKPVSHLPFLTDPEPRLRVNYTTLERLKHQIPFAIYSLAKSEQLLQTLLASAPAGIYRTENGTIVYANDYILNLTGYSRNELVGNSARLLFANDHEFKRAVKEGLLIQLNNQGSGEFRWMHKNGDILHVLLSAAVIEPVDISGSYTITVIDITDKKLTEARLSAITDWFIAGLTIVVVLLLLLLARLISSLRQRKKAEEELKQKVILEKKIEVAEESLRFKQNFLANMSHEIRTPLTGILGMTDILEQTPLNENQLDYINTIKVSGEQLKEIINQVLDFSKIEAGKITLKPSAFHFNTLMDDSLLLFRNNAKQGVSLHIQTDPRIPEYIFADRNRMAQVINNLISNALKFTEKGQVVVKSTLLSQLNTHNEILIKTEIIDTGIGIQDHIQQMLFSPFTQAEDNDTRKFEGTGLGLSICKDLVEMLGGEIGVESEYGKGSTFWFTIKASVAADPGLSITSKPINGKPQRKLNILCAEDKLVNQKVISLILIGMGHEITIVGDGQQLLDVFKSAHYDLVLMDIQMPVMDGITATGILRKEYQDLPPIVGLSANAFEGDREKYLSLGLDEYLIKPFKKSDFNDLIDKLHLA